MEGFPKSQKIEIIPTVVEPLAENPNANGLTSVEIVGEIKFNRLQELGASLAAGQDLSNEDREEYLHLNNEFIVAANSHENVTNVIAGREGSLQDSTENSIVVEMDEEKIERLQTLNRVKDQLGFLSDGDEAERTQLISEYNAAFLKYMRDTANSAPSSIEFESPVEIYTENDVLKWKDGAQRFESFSEVVREASMREKFEEIFNPIDANALKAVFLKEKPAVLLETPINPNDSSSEVIIKLLESFGMGIAGRYVYEKEQVRGVVETHEDIFKTFGSNDPDEVMTLISDEKTEDNNLDLAVGILLGFPIESVKEFEHYKNEERKGIKFPKSQRVNVYGVQWADFSDSAESKIRQAKLKAAFELSGVLRNGPQIAL